MLKYLYSPADQYKLGMWAYSPILLISAILTLSSSLCLAQTTDQVMIQENIQALFDGMRASDSTMLMPLFYDGATLRSVSLDRDGATKEHNSEISTFITAVGQPKDQIWDERIHSYDIKVDGPLGIAWTPYSFYIGDQLSHCGVNAFTMIKKDGRWYIADINDTRKSNDCN